MFDALLGELFAALLPIVMLIMLARVDVAVLECAADWPMDAALEVPFLLFDLFALPVLLLPLLSFSLLFSSDSFSFLVLLDSVADGTEACVVAGGVGNDGGGDGIG